MKKIILKITKLIGYMIIIISIIFGCGILDKDNYSITENKMKVILLLASTGSFLISGCYYIEFLQFKKEYRYNSKNLSKSIFLSCLTGIVFLFLLFII